jgi:hypothetical protein
MVKVCDFESYEDYYITIKDKKCEKVGYNMKVNEEIKSLNEIIMIRDYLKTKYKQNDTSLYTLSNKPYSDEVKYKPFLVMSDDNSKVIIVREGKVSSSDLNEKKDQDGDSGKE